MMMAFARGLVGLMIGIGAVAWPGAASATSLLYRFTPGPGEAGAFSFLLDDATPPQQVVADTSFVDAITDGAGVFAGVHGVTFYNTNYLGGLTDFLGPQLYTGSEQAPIFKTGTFTLQNSYANYAYGTLTVRALGGSAVPEPGSWAMMTIGFVTVGAAMRRRRGRPSLPLADARSAA